jgi:hypothetical protein
MVVILTAVCSVIPVKMLAREYLYKDEGKSD